MVESPPPKEGIHWHSLQSQRCLALEQKLATMTRKFKSENLFLGNFLVIRGNFLVNKKQLAANKVIFVELTLTKEDREKLL